MSDSEQEFLGNSPHPSPEEARDPWFNALAHNCRHIAIKMAKNSPQEDIDRARTFLDKHIGFAASYYRSRFELYKKIQTEKANKA